MLVWLFNGFYLSTANVANHSNRSRNGFIYGIYGSKIKKICNDINSRAIIEYHSIKSGPLQTRIWKSESLPQNCYNKCLLRDKEGYASLGQELFVTEWGGYWRVSCSDLSDLSPVDYIQLKTPKQNVNRTFYRPVTEVIEACRGLFWVEK